MYEHADSRDEIDVTNETDADRLFELIERSARIPRSEVHGPFLGLGAGEARAEKRLAKLFNIPDTVLVDKSIASHQNGHNRYIQADIFSFLNTDPGTYGLVTALGMEYVFQHQQYWQNLWASLPRVTRPGSVVVVRPSLYLPIPKGSPFATKLAGGTLIAQRTSPPP